MNSPLRVLIVEDSEDDALLVVRELTKGGFHAEHRRVDSPDTLQDALTADGWDIVITDHNLPEFGSEAAIKQVREADLDLPIIIVSGAIGEDIAVAAMKSGAHDYIMKSNLSRLVPAVERELREAQNRQRQRVAELELHYLAYHDPLTGLCNRIGFEQRLNKAIACAGEGTQHALFYLDLDQFKIVNDTSGHVAGDELLKQIATLLRGPVREADTLARLGGDEFGVLLENCNLQQALPVAERMLQLIRDFRFTWMKKSFNIGVSIGLVMLDNPDQSHNELMRAADMACYAAKDKGRGRIHLYRPDDVELTKRRGEMEWVSQIDRALEEDRFVLFQQSIVALDVVTGPTCEFLLRLRGDDGALILPGAFIPAAERYDLMPRIDRWVVEHVFDHLARRFAATPADAERIYFINLSGATLGDESFLPFVKAALARAAIPPQSVCFEVTETAAIGNLSNALSFINDVKSMGCKVALDDFGSGLSSFSYLKTLAADFLKIDGAFVRNMLADPMDVAIVQAINDIGHVAGLQTIAEFVEHDDIRSGLTDIGVNFAQGWAIHRPQAVEG
jgi:diguanylate cyclase (GGDEF)-like protein